ncbi:hypothetical protein ACFX2J_034362 [Malus domestica]
MMIAAVALVAVILLVAFFLILRGPKYGKVKKVLSNKKVLQYTQSKSEALKLLVGERGCRTSKPAQLPYIYTLHNNRLNDTASPPSTSAPASLSASSAATPASPTSSRSPAPCLLSCHTPPQTPSRCPLLGESASRPPGVEKVDLMRL